MLLLGTLAMACMGGSTAVLALLLVGAIVLYDAVHKAVAFSPVIMASCRLLLLLAAASVGADGVTGIALWASSPSPDGSSASPTSPGARP